MDIKERIKPFILVESENSTSVILNVGDYKHNIFLERSEEGFEGSGYDWGSLADVFIKEKCPHLENDISFDPEADMFCVYSKNKEAIIEFAVAFHDMCEDEVLMRKLFLLAELD